MRCLRPLLFLLLAVLVAVAIPARAQGTRIKDLPLTTTIPSDARLPIDGATFAAPRGVSMAQLATNVGTLVSANKLDATNGVAVGLTTATVPTTGPAVVNKAALDAASALALTRASNLSDLASSATARSNLGLGSVDNTSDIGKPVSTLQSAANTAVQSAAAADASTKANAAQAASQPLDSDLTAIAAVATASYGRGLLAESSATTARATLALGTLATQSGTFSGTSSGVNTGDQTTISGNAATATALQTPRAINGVSFDGTAAITVTAAAGTLTGATLASGLTNSSLVSAAGGTLGTAAYIAAATKLDTTNGVAVGLTTATAPTVGNSVVNKTALDAAIAADASSIRAAASDYAAVSFDGTTSGTRVTSMLTGQNIGTGNFSVWARFRVPADSGVGRGLIQLSSASTAGFVGQEFTLYIRSGGTIAARINGATAADYRISEGGNIITTYAGQVIDVVFTRSGTTVAMYINGTSITLTDVTSGTVPTWADTITSTYCHVGSADSTVIFTGRIYRSVVFNRALSASDVTELITSGVNPADQWGTQTAIYTSDFSTASTDGFTSSTCTIASNIDSIGGQDNNLRTTIDGTTGVHLFARAVTLPRAKTVRVVADFYRPASNTVVTGVSAQHYNQYLTLTTTQLVADTWTTITQEVRDLAVSGSTSALVWFLCNVTGAISVVGNSTDVVYVRNIQVTRIGAIVDLDFTVGTGYQTYDLSSNNLHGTLFGGVEFMMPRRSAVLYATTSTLGNQQMLGTLAIPTNAIIEDIIVNSTGVATVSIGNAVSGTQVVNAAAVIAGRQKLTIATPYSTTGNLYVSSSTGVILQFTISYTIAQ